MVMGFFESNDEKLRKIERELDELFRYQAELIDRTGDPEADREYRRVSQQINRLMEKQMSIRPSSW